MDKLAWVAVIVGSVIGAVLVLIGWSRSGDLSVIATIMAGLAFAIIPYCVARALSEIQQRE